MKITLTIILTTFLSGIAVARQAGSPMRQLMPGTVHGDISINEVSGNHLGNFSCGNLTVYISKLCNEDGWKRKTTATGNFPARRCSFRVTDVPAGQSFVASLTAQFPNACDEKKFETTTSFPMKLKGNEQLKYSFLVSRIRCVLVK